MNIFELPISTLETKFGRPVFSDTDPKNLYVPEVRLYETVLRASVQIAEDGLVLHESICVDESPSHPLARASVTDEEKPFISVLRLYKSAQGGRAVDEPKNPKNGLFGGLNDGLEGGLLVPVR